MVLNRLSGRAPRNAVAQAQHVLESKLAAIDRSQCVIEFDLSGDILSANENFLRATGYTAGEVIGRNHRMFLPPDYAESPAYEQFWRRLTAGEVIADRFMRLGKGGREIWIQAAYNPILGNDGKPFMVIKYATDVTASELLAADHAGQISAIEKSEAVITFDLTGIVLSANETFLRCVGYTAAELIGQHHSMLVDPADASGEAYESFWQRLSTGESLAGEFRRIAKGGREIWLQAFYAPILDPSGRPFKVVKYGTDVTATKERSADHAGQIEAIDKSQAVISFDLDGRVLTANANFLALMGYTAAEVIGRNHSIFVDDDDA
jgi:methyl-accepting chemotaxis protein